MSAPSIPHPSSHGALMGPGCLRGAGGGRTGEKTQKAHPLARAAVLAAVLFSLASAQAAPVLDQPLVLIDGRTSFVSGGTTGFVTYDRIKLAQSYEINKVTWVGAFFDAANPANNPVLPAADSWTFQVVADAAGKPGAVTDSTNVAFADVTATLLGTTGLSGQPVRVYSFSATLADSLHIAGGLEQWFTLFAESAATNPMFAWFSGSGGDGLSEQTFLGTSTFSSYTDRAMTLEGYKVPEPSVLLLASLGLAGLAVVRRRKA